MVVGSQCTRTDNEFMDHLESTVGDTVSLLAYMKQDVCNHLVDCAQRETKKERRARRDLENILLEYAKL